MLDSVVYIHKALSNIQGGDMRVSQRTPLLRSQTQTEVLEACKRRQVPNVSDCYLKL